MINPETATAPHSIDAEQATLGSMLISEAAALQIAPTLSAGDFYRPAHQVLFSAINKVRADHGHADPVFVAEHLKAAGELTRVGGAPYLHTLTEAVATPASGPHYANVVRGYAVTRRLVSTGLTIAQRGHEAALGDDPIGAVAGLTEAAVRDLEAVRDFELGDDITTPTITEFLAIEDEDYDWIVPNLLERGDRLILTGGEGAGKSTLFRQLAVTIAAGCHPFGLARIKPHRVLVIDCENSERHLRRQLRALTERAARIGYQIPEANLWIECKPEGMDLARDRDMSWLMKRIATIRPDVVTIGPLYRLVPRSISSDDEAAPVLAALNLIRARGACVLLEAHAGHATTGQGGSRDLRPRGSSALMGWPEFGYGLRKSEPRLGADGEHYRRAELEPWRGDRDEREWPDMLEAGGRWPWMEPQAMAVNPYAESSR